MEVAIEIRVDHHFHFRDGHKLRRQLGCILAIIAELKQKGLQMSQEMDDLVAEVAATQGVSASVAAIIDGLEDMLTAAGIDQAKLTEMRASLSASRQQLIDATSNSPTRPVDPPPIEPPPVDPPVDPPVV